MATLKSYSDPLPGIKDLPEALGINNYLKKLIQNDINHLTKLSLYDPCMYYVKNIQLKKTFNLQLNGLIGKIKNSNSIKNKNSLISYINQIININNNPIETEKYIENYILG